MTASTLTTEQPRPNPWTRARGLVFLGFRIKWKRRLSDSEMHLRHAESWESEVAHWQISGRVIELISPDIGYFVDLRDGEAHFRCESAAGYEQALKHASDLVGTLVRERRTRASAAVEAQHVLPVEESFEALRDKLSAKLLNDSMLKVVNAQLTDLAYMVDARINDRDYVFNIGPVRDREIRSRVAARTLTKLPPVAIFFGITTKKPYEYDFDDLSSYVDQTIDLGNRLLTQLES